jgi:hypothetical protein
MSVLNEINIMPQPVLREHALARVATSFETVATMAEAPEDEV